MNHSMISSYVFVLGLALGGCALPSAEGSSQSRALELSAKTDMVQKGIDPYVDDPYIDDPYVDDPYVDDPYVDDPYVDDPYIDDPYIDDPYIDDPYIDGP